MKLKSSVFAMAVAFAPPVCAGGMTVTTIPAYYVFPASTPAPAAAGPDFMALAAGVGGTALLLCLIGIICDKDKGRPHTTPVTPPTPAPIPLPALIVLLGGAIGGLALLRRRQRT